MRKRTWAVGLAMCVVWAGCLGIESNPHYQAEDGGSANPGPGELEGGSSEGGTGTDAASSADGSAGSTGGDDAGSADGGDSTGTTGDGDGGDCTKRDWYLDVDGDGVGAGMPVSQCDSPGDRYVLTDGDPQPQCFTDSSADCTPGQRRCAGDAGVGREHCVAVDGCLTWEKLDDCPQGAPFCEGQGECLGCVEDGDCDDSAPICQAGRCLECLENVDCGSEAPFCEDQRCVECLADSDCGPDAPVCANHTCTGCGERAECERFPETAACDLEDGGMCVECTPRDQAACTGQATPMCADDGLDVCVQCNAQGDCAKPGAPQCREHQCTACDPASPVNDCAGIRRSGRLAELCMEQGGTNLCVECIQDSDCGGNALCTEQHYCAEGKPNSAEYCEPCLDDRQCKHGGVCVANDPGSNALLPEGTCYPAQTGNTCATPGYAVGETGSDVRGASRPYCMPRYATCEQMLHWGELCPAAEGNGNAGPPFCISAGGRWLRSVPCAAVVDCPVVDVSGWECTSTDGQREFCRLKESGEDE